MIDTLCNFTGCLCSSELTDSTSELTLDRSTRTDLFLLFLVFLVDTRLVNLSHGLAHPHFVSLLHLPLPRLSLQCLEHQHHCTAELEPSDLLAFRTLSPLASSRASTSSSA